MAEHTPHTGGIVHGREYVVGLEKHGNDLHFTKMAFKDGEPTYHVVHVPITNDEDATIKAIRAAVHETADRCALRCRGWKM